MQTEYFRFRNQTEFLPKPIIIQSEIFQKKTLIIQNQPQSNTCVYYIEVQRYTSSVVVIYVSSLSLLFSSQFAFVAACCILSELYGELWQSIVAVCRLWALGHVYATRIYPCPYARFVGYRWCWSSVRSMQK